MSILKTIKDKTFDTREAFFKALKANKDAIIKEKKGVQTLKSTSVSNIDGFDYSNAPFPTKKGYFYAVINSTNIMDSHDDVHLETTWNKSAVEQNGKTFYVIDHDLSVNGLAVHKSDVNIQLHKTTFKDIGVELDGETTLLVYEMPESEIKHPKVVDTVAKREQLENSVRMEYINPVLCINSDSEEFKSEKKDYDKHITKVANRDVVDEQGYFFAHSEAKIVNEGSLVLAGSNSATPIFYHKEEIKEIEPSQDTQKEPSQDTQNQIDYKSLSQKFKKLRNE